MMSRQGMLLSRLVRFNSITQKFERSRTSLPLSTGVYFTPQQEAWVVERFGKYHKTLEPGLNFALPFVDKVKYIQVLKEIAMAIDEQTAITKDNVTLTIDGVLYLKIFDPYKASYGVDDVQYAVKQLAQTTMRSELGKISLDNVFQERESLNIAIVESMNKPLAAWGVDCKRYEIRDIGVPSRVRDAMQMQVEAERKKRASILESEGMRQADINIAEGKKQARVLTSEAYKSEQVNQASGEAEAILARAQAQSEAIKRVAQALGAENGHNAVSVSVAEKYIHAFEQLAKTGNTLILPSSTGDVSSMVAQAMGIYKSMDTGKSGKAFDELNAKTQGKTSQKLEQPPDYQSSIELEPAPIQIESNQDFLVKPSQ